MVSWLYIWKPRLIQTLGTKVYKSYIFTNFIHILQLNKGQIQRLTITPDQKYLISVSEDKTAKIWNLNTFTEVASLAGHTGSILV